MKAEAGSVHLHMTISQSGESEGFIVPCVSFVSHADVAHLQEPYDRGQDLVPGQARQGEIPLHATADSRQHFSESDHARELGFVANFPPPWMVTALFSSAIIASGGLQMACRIRANPNLLP